MTTDQDQLALRNRLQDLLGVNETTTLWAMLRSHDDLVTKADLVAFSERIEACFAGFRTELRAEMVALRTELKQQDAVVRADLHSFIRTFITVQTATVVGVSGIVFTIVQLG